MEYYTLLDKAREASITRTEFLRRLITKAEVKARTTYRKLIAEQPQPEDYLNAGHTEWASGHVKEAYAYYLQAAAGKDFDFFANLFDADRPALLRTGIDPEEISLMRDEMQFVLPEEVM